MVIDEYGNRRFYGLYRGIVADNNDPINQGRLKLRVPQVLFDQVTDWAWTRNNPGVVSTPPAVGHGIWVLFEGGDPSFPVAVGTFGEEVEDYPNLSGSQFITYDEATGVIGGSDAIPTGGAPGQVLTKAGTEDYETTWTTPSPGASFTSVLKHEVKAGEALTIGQAVYVSSADGTNMIVSKASNATEATSSKTMGLIAQSLAHNGKGYVITEGLLAGLNTNSATAGDPVWLGTSGNLIYGLASKPIAPAHLVFIGIVTRANTNNGEIFVRPQNGFELNELHDVLISTPAAGNLVARNSANTLWENKTPTSLGLVTTSDTGSVTNTMLAGSIANTKLSNSSVTVNDVSVSLGGSIVVSATPTVESVTDASITPLGLSPSVITGTAVIDTDSRLTNKRTPVDGSVITTSIADANVTYAKIQDVSAQYRVLGRATAGAGVTEELTPNNLITTLNQATTALGVARGGTGATTLTSGGYLKGAGTSAITAQSGVPAGDLTGTLAYDRFPAGTVVGWNYSRTNTKAAYGFSSNTIISPLNISITPKYSNSMLVVQWMINYESDYNAVFRICRDGGLIYTSGFQGYNETDGAAWSGYAAVVYDTNVASTPGTTYIQYMVPAGSTAATTLQVSVNESNYSSGTFYLNRTQASGGTNAYEVTISNATIWEIKQ